jgi:hypothetical protein
MPPIFKLYRPARADRPRRTDHIGGLFSPLVPWDTGGLKLRNQLRKAALEDLLLRKRLRRGVDYFSVSDVGDRPPAGREQLNFSVQFLNHPLQDTEHLILQQTSPCFS